MGLFNCDYIISVKKNLRNDGTHIEQEPQGYAGFVSIYDFSFWEYLAKDLQVGESKLYTAEQLNHIFNTYKENKED